MEINIGISECDKNVDNYYSRNIGSHTAPAERFSTVSSPFMVKNLKIVNYRDSPVSAVFWTPAYCTIGKTALIKH